MKWRRPLIYGLLVIGVLVFLAVLIHRRGGQGRWSVRASRAQIAIFTVALDTFKIDNGRYPSAIEELIAPLPGTTNWHGPYLDPKFLRIPWHREYVYAFPGKHNMNSFDLMSAGPDGRAGTDDDITNWQPKL